MKLSIDAAITSGVDSFPAWYSQLAYAGLTANDEDFLDRIQEYVDHGAISATGLDGALFDRIAHTDRFRELDAIVRKRTNDERAKLGLDPYQSFVVSN